MKKKLELLVLFIIAAAILCAGCSQNSENDDPASGSGSRSVTDILGREVTLTGAVEKVIAIGPGALRLYCYAGDIDKIAGIEQFEKDDISGRPYILANDQLVSLPVIGAGGPNSVPDLEKIVMEKPDVIFTTTNYAADIAAADELQAKTQVPVVVLGYGAVSTFDPEVDASLLLVGQVLEQENKAQGIIDYIAQCRQDLNDRTKDIDDGEKPSVYAGALGSAGFHGIESTRGEYALFEAVNAVNVVDETGQVGSVMIDKEKILEWDPDKIFIDYEGLAMVQDDYAKNPQLYQALSAYKNDEIYSQLPYNWYNTNIEVSLCDAYYIGKVLYPEQFADIDIAEKSGEIITRFVGENVFPELVEQYGEFVKISLE